MVCGKKSKKKDEKDPNFEITDEFLNEGIDSDEDMEFQIPHENEELLATPETNANEQTRTRNR